MSGFNRGKLSERDVVAASRLLAEVVGDHRTAADQRACLLAGVLRLTGADRAGLVAGEGVREDGGARQISMLLETVDGAGNDAIASAYQAGYADAMADADERRDNPLIAAWYARPRASLVSASSGALLRRWREASPLPGRPATDWGRFAAWLKKEGIADLATSTCRLGSTPHGERLLGLSIHRMDGALTLRQRLLLRRLCAEAGWHARRGSLALPEVRMNPWEVAARLSPRRQEVLQRLLAGGHPKGIARALGLSVYTVRDHVKEIHQAFGVCGRDELMATFIDHDQIA